MDADRFDHLTTRLSHHLTRRQGLSVLAALGLAVTLPPDTDARGRRRRRRRNGRGNGGNNDRGNFPPPPPPPAPECTADTGCNEGLGEVCRDTRCQCPGGSVRDQDRYCVCPFGTVWCSGACREQECCSLTDCPGRAQCISGQCVCADPCCKDTDCGDTEQCVDGVCEECPGCEACPFGSERMQCNGRAGTSCCSRIGCDGEAPGQFGYHRYPICADNTCLVYGPFDNIGIGGNSCGDYQRFPVCNSNDDCAANAECLYNPCCNRFMCLRR